MRRTIIYNNEEALETDYPGYFVTRSGKVISTKVKGGQGKIDYNNPRYHNEKIDKDGYHEVLLSNGSGQRKYMRVHRLVWETFNGKIEDDLTIDHIDSNVNNNDLSNLQLMTRKANVSKAKKNKKSTKRFMYHLYNNNEYIGTFDRKELQEIFNFSTNFWYKDGNKDNIIDYNKDIVFKRV